jgi:hypothetical protein
MGFLYVVLLTQRSKLLPFEDKKLIFDASNCISTQSIIR